MIILKTPTTSHFIKNTNKMMNFSLKLNRKVPEEAPWSRG